MYLSNYFINLINRCFFVLLVVLFLSVMVKTSITSINVDGCKDSLRRFRIFEALRQSSSEIFFLQETSSVESDEAQWRVVWRGAVEFSHFPAPNRAGVAILFAPFSGFAVINRQEIIPGRALFLRVKKDLFELNLINLYAPNNGPCLLYTSPSPRD